MRPLGDPRDHYWLVQGMARAIGVDIVGAFEAGHLDHEEWAEIVECCRRCDWSAGCRDWLASAPAASCPPPECCNRARLALLRLEQELAR